MFHGDIRSNTNYCVMCHNANNPNDERMPRIEGQTVLARSTHFKPMIHSIHSGEELELGYALGSQAPSVSNPAGRITDFSEVRYPNDRRDCNACHIDGAFDLGRVATMLPSREEVLACTEDPVADADTYCQTRVVSETRLTPAVTASCISCHDAPETSAHAEVMTSAMGVESCATCHDPGSYFGIDAVHQREP
jgi:OmcA/MtrC family decaheme c-type cytochrome